MYLKSHRKKESLVKHVLGNKCNSSLSHTYNILKYLCSCHRHSNSNSNLSKKVKFKIIKIRTSSHYVL